MTAKTKISIVAALIIGFSINAAAQRDTIITQQVDVVKTYNPTIANADKINDMPVLNEGEPQKPSFNYGISSQPVFGNLTVNDIKAATFSLQPDSPDGFGLLRAGYGNYNRPYGELFLNSRKSGNTMLTLHGRHLSSSGKVELRSGDKVKAPLSESEASLSVRHLTGRSVLTASLTGGRTGFNYYGYPLSELPTASNYIYNDLNRFGTTQAFTSGGVNINLKNQTAGFDDPAWDFNISYRYFGTKTDQREHLGKASAGFVSPLSLGTLIMNMSATYITVKNIYNNSLYAYGSRHQTWLEANPAWRLGSENANITAGVKLWYVTDPDADNKAKIAPDIRVNLTPVAGKLSLYAGLDGRYISNHYSKIAADNPFVDPEHDVQNSFEKLRLYGGVNGKIAPKTNFGLSAQYTKTTGAPMYYLSTRFRGRVLSSELIATTIVDNTFNILYDDIKTLKLSAEVFHAATQRLDLLVSGNYYINKTSIEQEAWNMPDWDAKMALGYRATDKLKLTADIFAIGQRKALVREYPLDILGGMFRPQIYEIYKLDTAVDINLGADYRITRRISAFAQLHNVGFQKYEQWLGYTVQGFNFLAGISCSF